MTRRLKQKNTAGSVAFVKASAAVVLLLLAHPRLAESNLFQDDTELIDSFSRNAMMKNALVKCKGLNRRTITGYGNNVANPDWGAAGTSVLKQCAAAPPDADGTTLPNVRTISNDIGDDSASRSAGGDQNSFEASDLFWQWGQFLDHDVVLIEHTNGTPMNINIPLGDSVFDPTGTGTATMPLTKSDRGPDGRPVNSITSFIDASNVYGSDDVRAQELRTLSDGLLKTEGDLGLFLPNNGLDTVQLPNAPHGNLNFPIAGDVRANEQLGLLAMHTLWVREHNAIAAALKHVHPDWLDEDYYQVARKIVGAEMQVITYHEFLPLLLGPYATPGTNNGRGRRKYDPTCDATMADEFVTAAFRLGHTLVSPNQMLLREDMTPSGTKTLVESFFAPDELQVVGMDDVVRGQAAQMCQSLDHRVATELRNMLFEGSPAAHSGGLGFDLAALNMQRGRDHGLCSLNHIREAYGLARHATFDDINPGNPALTGQLATLYNNDVDKVEAWIGMISEDHLPYAQVGPTLAAVLAEQFDRTRRCDRFWYENDLPRLLHMFVEGQTLSKVIRRNTGIGFEMNPSCMEEAMFFNGASIDSTSSTA